MLCHIKLNRIPWSNASSSGEPTWHIKTPNTDASSSYFQPISFTLERVSVTLRYCIVICQPPGASWHLSAVTKALSERSGPRFAPSRTVWCRLMRATARRTDDRREGSYAAVPSVRSTMESWSSGHAVADEPPIRSSNKEQNDNAGRIQCPRTFFFVVTYDCYMTSIT